MEKLKQRLVFSACSRGKCRPEMRQDLSKSISVKPYS